MIDRSLLLASTLLVSAALRGQCTINTNASQTTITCGSCVTLSAFGSSGLTAFSEDFNSGAPTGWQFTQSAQFNNPCSPGGVDGTTHLWMGPGSTNPRDMVTFPLDLTLGGSICFDMLFAEQGDNSPCEGPDEPQEGVYLQYSVDNGATWVTINYFDPNGGYDPQLTNWNNWCFPLPPGAITPNTMIRWHQDDVTDDIYDHWGIDNVQITLNDPSYGVSWLHDGYAYGLGQPGGDNPTPVCPMTTTTYTAIVSDGTTSCSSDITITVVDPVIVMTAGNDTTMCTGDCAVLAGDAYHLVSPASTPTFENTEFALVVAGNSSININVQGLNTTSLVDGSITSVCINGFNFSGTFLCTSLAGCDCNGTPIGFFENCDVTSAGFMVTLTTPGGCEILLAPASTAPGNYNNTCFVPVGGAPQGGSFPTGGTWDPAEPFSDLNGCDPNGVWTLEFSAPGIGFGLGTLTGWNISFDDPEIVEPVDFVWSPTTDMTGSNTLTPEVCPTATTTYTLSATDQAGCLTVTDDVTITMQNCCALEITDVVVVQPSCGASDGSITVTTLTGEITGVTYSLDAGPPQATPSFGGLAAGQYTITVNDDNGCPVDQVIDLAPGDGPEITGLVLAQPACGALDGSITITATGLGSQYSIDNGVSFQPGTAFNGLGPGTYDLVVLDISGCTADSTVSLNAAGAPQITGLAGTAPSCANDDGEIVITAIGAVEYSIDGGASFQPLDVFFGLVAGTYDILVQDATGCSADSTITLTAANAPNIDDVIIVQPTCGSTDGQLEIVVTPAAVDHSIDNGATFQPGPIFTGLGAGTYDIVVVDALGCTATAQAVLSSTNGPTIDDVVLTPADCGDPNGTATVSATGTNLQYSIDGGVNFQPGNTFSALQPGLYDLVIEDPTGCSATTQFVILELPGPTIDLITTTDASCGVDNGTITITATGAGLTYSIDNGATYQSGDSFTGLAAGVYNVVITNGCAAADVVNIGQSPGPVIDLITPVDPTCAGDQNGSLTIEASGGQPLSFSIDGGATLGAASVFNGLAAGTYDIVVQDGGGCSTTAVADLVAPVALGLDVATVDPGCAGVCTGTATAAAVGGTPGYVYTWSNGASGPLFTSITGLCAGNYDLYLTDANGCSLSAVFSIADPGAFTIDAIAATGETCTDQCDGTVTALALGADSYSLNGGPLQTSGSFTGLCAGTYTLEAFTADGCAASGSVDVAPGVEVQASFFATPTETNTLAPDFVFTNTSTGAVA
ncbi:MAG: hypothetical protein KDB84_06560, partial [Flavobacteriales bacterium]|nr:hypothetical protein [Flavobacteriales bacterium]